MTNKCKTLQKKLSYGDLSKISLEPFEQEKLELTVVLDLKYSILVTVQDPTLFSFSRTFGDDGAYFIGEFNITKINKNDVKILKELNYGYVDKNGEPCLGAEVAYWFHIEGGIVLDIICRDYELQELYD